MEFLRFGSSIPGAYWGCCAVCIIQNFKVEPDAPASIQLVSGDGGGSIGGGLFAGPTNRDIFHQRLRIGTFGAQDMPNHGFLAILTEWQIKSALGKRWLAILREAGFEFIRTVNNSVYSGSALGSPTANVNNNDNYIFGLFRNIGRGGLKDPFTPPKEWTDLPKVKTEVWDFVSLAPDDNAWNWNELTKTQHTEDTSVWNAIGKPTFLTEAQVVAAGAPVTLAGRRSKYPQQVKSARESVEALEAMNKAPVANAFSSPMPAAQ